MKFDEAIERLSQNIDDNGGQEAYQGEVIGTLKSLRDKYAPDVKMTSEQKDLFLFYKHCTWFSVFIAKLNDPENDHYKSLPSLQIFNDWGWRRERENELMHAWLYPETIKVVN
ncbi:hypothetical protein [Leuconostoc falkenbergense]|uniref:hypothetical protein n=2 Tax=Leuconostoc TaxID=1243 RepID=UPI002FC94EEE